MTYKYRKVKPRARRVPGVLNKTEAEYAAILEKMKRAGEIVDYKYEAVTFRLAPKTTLTPDFYVKLENEIQIHEVKGGLIRDDAGAKFKIAAELFPEFRWIMMQKKNQKTGWVKIREL